MKLSVSFNHTVNSKTEAAGQVLLYSESGSLLVMAKYALHICKGEK